MHNATPSWSKTQCGIQSQTIVDVEVQLESVGQNDSKAAYRDL